LILIFFFLCVKNIIAGCFSLSHLRNACDLGLLFFFVVFGGLKRLGLIVSLCLMMMRRSISLYLHLFG